MPKSYHNYHAIAALDEFFYGVERRTNVLSSYLIYMAYNSGERHPYEQICTVDCCNNFTRVCQVALASHSSYRSRCLLLTIMSEGCGDETSVFFKDLIVLHT